MNFNPENKFFSFMSLIGDLIVMNLLFIITSIPVLTFGASSCALYLSVKKRIRGEESYIIRDYLKAWKENLKGGVCIWSVLLIFLAGMILFTSYIAGHLTNLPAIIVYSLLFMWLSFTLLYAFPLQATFINTPSKIILNSFLTALRHLPWTLAMFLITYIPLILTLAFPQAVSVSVIYWLFIGGSLSMSLNSPILRRVLDEYISTGNAENTTEENSGP